MEEFSYRKLRVYQHSKKLVLLIYDLLKYFPKEENYALCDQLRRAVISIPSNIAEGISRTSHKEQGIITQEHLQLVEEYYRLIAQMLSGLRRSRIEGHT